MQRWSGGRRSNCWGHDMAAKVDLILRVTGETDGQCSEFLLDEGCAVWIVKRRPDMEHLTYGAGDAITTEKTGVRAAMHVSDMTEAARLVRSVLAQHEGKSEAKRLRSTGEQRRRRATRPPN